VPAAICSAATYQQRSWLVAIRGSDEAVITSRRMCSKPATSAAVWCAAVRPRGRVPHMLAHRPYGGHPYRASIARPTHHRYNSSGGSRQPAAIANTRRPVLAKAQRCLVSLKLPSQTPRTTPSTSAWRSAQAPKDAWRSKWRRPETVTSSPAGWKRPPRRTRATSRVRAGLEVLSVFLDKNAQKSKLTPGHFRIIQNIELYSYLG
jgi:hypothetical protein